MRRFKLIIKVWAIGALFSVGISFCATPGPYFVAGLAMLAACLYLVRRFNNAE